MFDFDRHPISSLLAALVSAVLVVAALVMFIWGLTTNFSYWWGQQGAIQEKNSTQNWTTAQRAFHQEMGDVTAYRGKIKDAFTALNDFDKAHNLAAENGLVGMQDAQTRQGLVTDYTGLKQQCLNTVTQYNTDAQSYLTEDWRGANLPSSLSQADCGF